MKVTVRREGDLERLDELIARERVAVQRDRLRAVRLALDGVEALQIAATLSRSRRFVQEWAYAYRDGGVEAIRPGKSSGRPTKLPRDKEQAFRARMLGGAVVTGKAVAHAQEMLSAAESQDQETARIKRPRPRAS